MIIEDARYLYLILNYLLFTKKRRIISLRFTIFRENFNILYLKIITIY